MENNIEHWGLSLNILSEEKLTYEVLDLSSAIEKLFDYPKDVIILRIDNLLLRLPLSYCFSDLLDDFINIISDVSEADTGFGIYGFSQNEEFDADWKLDWKDDLLRIKFIWRISKFDKLELPNEIIISKETFLNSWYNVFSEIFKLINKECLIDKTEYELLESLIRNNGTQFAQE